MLSLKVHRFGCLRQLLGHSHSVSSNALPDNLYLGLKQFLERVSVRVKTVSPVCSRACLKTPSVSYVAVSFLGRRRSAAMRRASDSFESFTS